ncbi:BatA domain-containing protein [Mucilaginibacter sp.]|uniref:BatA domain-containing protein n=1 Tax=Mucilaginibacter sp. TaxID=1882438 RepID=UPI0035BC8C86
MHFLTPVWFFAMAAVSIPVVIHLWNTRPGKSLKIGSIALITEASKSNRRSFKLLDILLFILRCSLLTVLAFLLAVPVWEHVKPAEKVKGWVLISKANMREAYEIFKPKIDSLTRVGYQFHYFNAGFAKGDLPKILADSTLKDGPSSYNYWNLVRQLNSKVSSELPLQVFTPSGIRHFVGIKPASPLKLVWNVYNQGDSVARWIADASLAPNGAVRVIIGNSSPEGVVYTNQVISNEGNADVAISVKNGQPIANLKGTEFNLPVDTTTLKIAIYTGKYSLDAGYLKAALTAAANFTGRKVIINQYLNPNTIAENQTWLFWLSDKPAGEKQAGISRNIFQYARGKVVAVKSWIDTEKGLIRSGKKVALTKMIIATNNGEPVWVNGFGSPVLEKKVNKKATFFNFYTHFNPAFTDLTWNEAFPKLLLDLMIEKQYQLPSKFDKRILSKREIQPDKIDGTTKVETIAGPAEQTDLSRYFWLLLVILFAAERWLSNQTKTVTANG